MPAKRRSKNPKKKRGKKTIAQSTLAFRAMAWTVAEWAKRFTTPGGTLAFGSPDERRALEVRLTTLVILAVDKHWDDLRGADHAAVDLLFCMTLGFGTQEVWQHHRNTIGVAGGAPMLLRCHDLASLPNAAVALNDALTALSADGLGGQIARDPEAWPVLFGMLEKLSNQIDQIYRKHSPPQDDLTWEDLARDLLKRVGEAHEGWLATASHRDADPIEAESKARQATAKPSRATEPTVLDAWNSLTDRQRNALRAMLELRAFDADSRKCCDEVAVKAESSAANVDGFKRPLADLVRRGLARSRIGQGGGYWLTATGRELLDAFDTDLNAADPS